MNIDENMINKRIEYPFSAIVGQEKMKKALMLNAINFNIGGVLIRGQKGTAKSTAVRALANLLPEISVVEGCKFHCDPNNVKSLCDECSEKLKKEGALPSVKRKMKVVTLPLGATEDRVVGTLDIEHAIKKGEKIFEPGILADAHRGILYVDEVNLLDDHLVDILLDSAAMGINYVQREGVAYSHPAKFILIGTMNPEEGELRPQLLDRFGLCVSVEGIREQTQRVDVMQRHMSFEDNPLNFLAEWENKEKELGITIAKAKVLFPNVKYDTDILELIASISVDMDVDGHRADIFMLKTAQTLAAYYEHQVITDDDVREAAELVLSHRMRKKPFQEPEINEDKLDESMKNHQQKKKPENKELKSQEQAQAPEEQGQENNEQKEPEGDSGEELFQSNEPYRVKKISLDKEMKVISGTGRRSESGSDSKTGRYVKNRIPNGKTNDIAFDATLRASSVHQLNRDKNGKAVAIESTDIREKVRKKKVGNTILFVVDSSGSMGVNKRMQETKTAIFSLLVDAYQKRDRVGMVVFKQNEAELILPPTSSVELAKKQLETIPTGGKTPLSKGLYAGLQCLSQEMKKQKDIKPLMIILSDGKANVSMEQGKNPFDEAKQIASGIKEANISSLVINTETGMLKFGRMEKLSEILDGKYFHLEDLKAESIVASVKETINQ